ncbi:hypothetical protein [Leptothoe sp. PORK10 BA2]|uniref:hypothetical protein n=1 Tax=Leptothoe sp. PORK10 BA2 TaxID=3110254 RepID=UPI002B20926C|nr:hypothetical protein [Leptothoe sp. PORK10 BA2]MEA5464084.1 hypothetical protein [Leptothoe sp. PORK10 BA2]
MKKLFIFKFMATALVAIVMLYPFWSATRNEAGSTGVLESLEAMGFFTTSAIVAAFILGVALYCRSLQKCLSLVQPSCQAMNPKMVWLMFVPFYNLVEDFFIILNVTRSIEQEAQSNKHLEVMNSFGRVSGFGWCIAQVASLFPSFLGVAASFIALILWVVHWRLIIKVNALLMIDGLDAKST